MSAARSLRLLGLALTLLAGCQRSAPTTQEAGPRRLVALAPGISETLYALGAGDQVVGLSDYSTWPPETASVTKVGSTLTPNYEAIARLKPTLILDEQVKQAPEGSLSSVAPVKVLPWLSVDDVANGIRELGRRTGREEVATKLAQKVETTLKRKAPPDAPRVLLVIGDGAAELSSIWYIRNDSLHGAALEAAGARNAVADAPAGPPNISIERLLTLDPDIILVLLDGPKLSPEEEARQLAAWKQLSVLRAVKQGHVRVVSGPGVQSTGPRILDLVEQLQAALRFDAKAP
ncbi:ABC transporter periplasmic substrate-binding protein [Myxococcus stipitatus DSM 14675]|uniref:ABC transporter periplasmic substrate-binding protein n=1 Tax=Myxococcus stipitatus (strain DSM 14675 / JCM 12634 / Mx s8) TaxID=1278073 RepID=L7U283_MYXSD|nr:helical backbone metal receptor [Myxococcus stipitatus]AGC42323.1 ABC transporter periplasmic substrate-binding protein [Myxococcus stipitatus DSM 14675]